MALNLDGKKAIVAQVAAEVAKAETIVVAEYRGIKVADMTRLRVQARAEGVYLRVLRNTLARRAMQDTPFSVLSDELTGPLIYGISEDAVAAAKVINTFAKTNDKIVIKVGSFDGKLLDAAAVKALAATPGRLELLAMLLGIMQAPVSGMARALAAVAAKKEAEGAAA